MHGTVVLIQNSAVSPNVPLLISRFARANTLVRRLIPFFCLMSRVPGLPMPGVVLTAAHEELVRAFYCELRDQVAAAAASDHKHTYRVRWPTDPVVLHWMEMHDITICGMGRFRNDGSRVAQYELGGTWHAFVIFRNSRIRTQMLAEATGAPVPPGPANVRILPFA